MVNMAVGAVGVPVHPNRLEFCTTFDEQVGWALTRLKAGGRLHDAGLWLGGVEEPMALIGKVKVALRAEGRVLSRSMETVKDAADEDHMMLVWRLAPIG